MNKSIRILGLDPGLRFTGWGIVQLEGNRLKHIAHGVVKSTSTLSFGERLRQIYEGVEKVIDTYSPDEAAVEETFVNKNPNSTLKLGMARGVVMVVPALKDLDIHEYSANRIKKTVVGAGHAEKEQVITMVGHLLPTAGELTSDAADALAAAICHSHFREAQHYLQKAS